MCFCDTVAIVLSSSYNIQHEGTTNKSDPE